ncbi:MAG TPA: GNAT family N-acetyltransferase [Dongiaceae bacterium]|jgi:RimJ/RimL family protein N-acetyltransferase
MILETNRLVLRPMAAGDYLDLLMTFGDPKVMAAFGVEPFRELEMKRWVARNLEHQERHGYGLFSVLHKADGILIGDCGLEHRDVEGTDEAELGYDIRSDYWNRGLATEAAAAVRDHAFQRLGLPRLISLVRHGNAASARVAEKVGMRRSGEFQQSETRYWVYALERGARDSHPDLRIQP